MSLFDAYRQKLWRPSRRIVRPPRPWPRPGHAALQRRQNRRLREPAATGKKLSALKAKLASAAAGGEGAWQDLKGGLDFAWTEVRDASSRALKRFE